jgi:AraC-like DNA-binding protein
MADDLNKRGSPDRDRININEEWELRDWSQKFGVSPGELKRAVQQVGDRADAVREHLGK